MIEGDLSPQFNWIIKFNIHLFYGTFPSFRRGLEVDLSLQYRVKIEYISKVEDEKIWQSNLKLTQKNHRILISRHE